MSRKPSVQLYSVRDAVQQDLSAAVARLAEIGLTQVEPYAFHTRTAEYKDAFAAAGVTAPSATRRSSTRRTRGRSSRRPTPWASPR